MTKSSKVDNSSQLLSNHHHHHNLYTAFTETIEEITRRKAGRIPKKRTEIGIDVGIFGRRVDKRRINVHSGRRINVRRRCQIRGGIGIGVRRCCRACVRGRVAVRGVGVRVGGCCRRCRCCQVRSCCRARTCCRRC
ncbi:unnamed protein product [Trichobilharzia regenti]|nr:unnamed protein product [Trichobilharzia regenti]